MRKLVSAVVLLMASLPVIAAVAQPLPEPEALALLAIGGVAMFMSRRKK